MLKAYVTSLFRKSTWHHCSLIQEVHVTSLFPCSWRHCLGRRSWTRHVPRRCLLCRTESSSFVYSRLGNTNYWTTSDVLEIILIIIVMLNIYRPPGTLCRWLSDFVWVSCPPLGRVSSPCLRAISAWVRIVSLLNCSEPACVNTFSVHSIDPPKVSFLFFFQSISQIPDDYPDEAYWNPCFLDKRFLGWSQSRKFCPASDPVPDSPVLIKMS